MERNSCARLTNPRSNRLKKALQSHLAQAEALLQDDVAVRLAKRTSVPRLGQRMAGAALDAAGTEITRLTMNFPDTLPFWYAHQKHRHEQLVALIESRKAIRRRAP